MRRTRRIRMSTDRNKVVNRLVNIIKTDVKSVVDLSNGERNRVFGRILNHWLDDTRESVIDRYVDEEAMEATNYAINIVLKELRQ